MTKKYNNDIQKILHVFSFFAKAPYIDLTRWLVQGGKVEEAKKVLEKLRGKGVAIDKVPIY